MIDIDDLRVVIPGVEHRYIVVEFDLRKIISTTFLTFHQNGKKKMIYWFSSSVRRTEDTVL